MKISHASLLLFILLAGPANAHRDRVLRLEKDGSIPDIPSSFGKARLLVENAGTDAMTVTLTIGTHTSTLPPCMTRFAQTQHGGGVRLAASWYHDETTMPYYVSVEFLDPGANPSRAYNSSHRFLFNLRDARLMEQKQFIANRAGTGGRFSVVSRPDNCEARWTSD